VDSLNLQGDKSMNRKPLVLVALATLLPAANFGRAQDSGPYKVLW